jgi:hypothetical protein
MKEATDAIPVSAARQLGLFIKVEGKPADKDSGQPKQRCGEVGWTTIEFVVHPTSRYA